MYGEGTDLNIGGNPDDPHDVNFKDLDPDQVRDFVTCTQGQEGNVATQGLGYAYCVQTLLPGYKTNQATIMAMIEWVESGQAEEFWSSYTGDTTTPTTTGGGWSLADSLKDILGIFCIPKSVLIDTPKGPVPVEDLSVGDSIIGYDGKIARLDQKQEHLATKDVKYFKLRFNDNSVLDLSTAHLVDDKPINNYKVGDIINGKEIVNIDTYTGVNITYDLLTNNIASPGYRIAGIPVNSMIPDASIKIGNFYSMINSAKEYRNV